MFLYGKVLDQPLGDIGEAVRAKGPRRLPVVLRHEEAMEIIAAVKMPYRLMVSLMYGAGLRLAYKGAVKAATRALRIDKPVGCHTFRHTFATELLRGRDPAGKRVQS